MTKKNSPPKRLKLVASPVGKPAVASPANLRERYVPKTDSHVDDMAQALARMHAMTRQSDTLNDAAVRDELGLPTLEEERRRAELARKQSQEADQRLAIARARRHEDYVAGFKADEVDTAIKAKRDLFAADFEEMLSRQISLLTALEKAATRLNTLVGEDTVGMDAMRSLCSSVFHMASLEAICNSAALTEPTKATILTARANQLFGPKPVAPAKDSLSKRDLIQAIGAVADRQPRGGAAPAADGFSRGAMAQRSASRPFGRSAPSNPFGDIPDAP